MEAKLIKLYEDEKTYRADSPWNYSKLADWTKKNSWSWRKRHVLGDDSDFEYTDGMRLGSASDCLIQGDEQEFKEKFFISSADKVPTPNNLKFCNCLLELYLERGEEEDMSTLCEVAYERAEIKTPGFPKFMEKFEGSDTENYFQDLVNSSGKIVLSLGEYEDVDRTVEVLKSHVNTQEIYQEVKGVEYLNQLALHYSYLGVDFKAMFDRLVIDHNNKKILPYDLKMGWDPFNFEWTFLDLRYYIQQGVYHKAAEAYRNQFYPDYDLESFKFCVIDNKALYDPIVWELDFGEGDEWNGFERGGRKYKGIWQIIEEINWVVKNDKFGTTQEIFNNQGKIKRTL